MRSKNRRNRSIGITSRLLLPDGTVGDVQIIRSLDPVFGLDQEAIKAAGRLRSGLVPDELAEAS